MCQSGSTCSVDAAPRHSTSHMPMLAGAAYAAVLPRVLCSLQACLGHGKAMARRYAAEALDAIAGSPHAEVSAGFADLADQLCLAQPVSPACRSPGPR